jgi:5-methyltetrahydropteroyltriglutamate--homocysteine methyltransferase
MIDIALTARVGAVSIEGANPRHAHAWKVFQEVTLPDGMMLIPGVIDSTTNFIEHPELVAERIIRLATLLGRENVIGGVDCGVSSNADLPPAVAPSIIWAKLHALAEGARLASQ